MKKYYLLLGWLMLLLTTTSFAAEILYEEVEGYEDVEFIKGYALITDNGDQKLFNPAKTIKINTSKYEKWLKDNPVICDYESAMILAQAYLVLEKKDYSLADSYYISRVSYDEKRGIYFFLLKEDHGFGTPDYLMAISQYTGAILDIILAEGID